MHPIVSVKQWGHGLYDELHAVRHHIDQHLHSRHFWAGVGITLLILGFISLVVMIAIYAPNESAGGFHFNSPYLPYGQ